MTSPESQRALQDEWEREKRKQRRSPAELLKSHAAPFFVAWVVFGAVAFCVARFAFDQEMGLSVILGVFAGLFAGLRIVLRVRR